MKQWLIRASRIKEEVRSMQKKFKAIASVMCSCALLMTGTVLPVVSAEEHYNVYNYDRWTEATPSQAGYEAVQIGRAHV